MFVFDVDQEDFNAGANKYDEVKSLADCKKAVDTAMVVECKKMGDGSAEFNMNRCGFWKTLASSSLFGGATVTVWKTRASS